MIKAAIPPGHSWNRLPMIGAVCALLGDPVRAADIAARGRERVRTHFDIKRSLTATAALYDDVLVEREAQRRTGDFQ